MHEEGDLRGEVVVRVVSGNVMERPKFPPRPKGYVAFEISNWLPHRRNSTTGKGGRWRLSSDKKVVDLWSGRYKDFHDWPEAEVRKFVRVTIVKGPRGMLEDWDNFTGYLKSILDGLSRPTKNKEIGSSLIVDDAHNWVTWEIRQAWAFQPAVRIEIWDAPPLEKDPVPPEQHEVTHSEPILSAADPKEKTASKGDK